MRRFLYTAAVKHVDGHQIFYIDAETEAEADARAKRGDSDGIYAEQREVQDLEDFEREGETTTDDFGAFSEYLADAGKAEGGAA